MIQSKTSISLLSDLHLMRVNSFWPCSTSDAVVVEGYYEDKANQANSYWLVRNSWGEG